MTVTLTRTPVFHTRRLILRAPEPWDVGPFSAFITSDRSRFVGGPLMGPGDAWRAWATIIGHWVMRGFGPFTIVRADSDHAIGLAGPWHPEGWPEAEIAWSLWSADDERQGLAAEAVVAARDFAFTHLGWKTAVTYIDSRDAASADVARDVGAQRDDAAATPPGSGEEDAAVHVWRHPRTAP